MANPICAGTCGQPVAPADGRYCGPCWSVVWGDHTLCLESEHLQCKGCGDPICLYNLSPHQQMAMRHQPFHLPCRLALNQPHIRPASAPIQHIGRAQ